MFLIERTNTRLGALSVFLPFIIATPAGCQKNVWHRLASSGKESVFSWEGRWYPSRGESRLAGLLSAEL